MKWTDLGHFVRVTSVEECGTFTGLTCRFAPVKAEKAEHPANGNGRTLSPIRLLKGNYIRINDTSRLLSVMDSG